MLSHTCIKYENSGFLASSGNIPFFFYPTINITKNSEAIWPNATLFNATFNNVSVISWVSFIGCGNRSYRRKTTDLPQVT